MFGSVLWGLVRAVFVGWGDCPFSVSECLAALVLCCWAVVVVWVV